MCASVYQRLISECPDPFRYMADFAVFYYQMPFHFLGVCRLDMKLSGTMANFTPRIFQVGGLFNTHKSSRLSVSCCVAEITSLNLFLSQALFYPLNALERRAFFCVRRKIFILALMTFFAGLGTNIARESVFCLSKC